MTRPCFNYRILKNEIWGEPGLCGGPFQRVNAFSLGMNCPVIAVSPTRRQGKCPSLARRANIKDPRSLLHLSIPVSRREIFRSERSERASGEWYE